MPVEILVPDTSAQQYVQQDLRTQLLLQVQALGLQARGNVLTETLRQDNCLLLNSLTYPAAIFTKTGTTLAGQPGSILQGAGFQGVNQAAQGIRFTEAVTLSPTARVVFTNCRFDRGVTMQAGSRASFQGCRFVDSIVNNAGLAADAGIVGCGRGATPHINCTVVFEWVV